jgi:non-haem Fe2+, alpha-ketoglutarate-dependent halogenase
MPKALTQAEVAAYRENGILFPLAALDPDEVGACRGALSRIEALPEPERSRVLKNKSHLVSSVLYDLVRKPAILDAVEDVIGPDLLVWGAGFFNKAPGSPDFVSWHQDATYWGLEPPDIVTAWVALTPSTVESGCMRVVPGSHRWPIVAHKETYAQHNMLSRGQEIAVEVREDDVTEVVLAPGQMSLHHVLIAHGSKPNRASHPRVGFAIRYIGGHVRQLQASRDTATLVRGRQHFASFEIEPAPRGELDPADLETHARIAEGLPHLPKPTVAAGGAAGSKA